jgi:hypothetical protein
MTRSVSRLFKIVLQHHPDSDIRKKKKDDVAQFHKSYSAIIDQSKFVARDIENL